MQTPVFIYEELTDSVYFAEYTWNPIRETVDILSLAWKVKEVEYEDEEDEEDEPEESEDGDDEEYSEDAEEPGEEGDEEEEEGDSLSSGGDEDGEEEEGGEGGEGTEYDESGEGYEEDEESTEEVEVGTEEAEDAELDQGFSTEPEGEQRSLEVPDWLIELGGKWMLAQKKGKIWTVYESLVSQLTDLPEARLQGFLQFAASREGGGERLNRYFGTKLTCRQDILDLLLSRSEKGMKQVQDFLGRIEEEDLPEIKDHTRRIRFSSEDGDELDYDRFRGGQDFWRTSQREERVSISDVTVFVDLSCPYYIDPDQMFWRAVAGVALSKMLEDKGYRVELWTVDGHQFPTGRFGGDNMRTHIFCHRAKRLEDMLDVGSILNCMTAWWFRGCCVPLAVHMIKEEFPERTSNSSGWVYNPEQEDLDVISTCPNRITISHVFSEEGALDLITDELKKLTEGGE